MFVDDNNTLANRALFGWGLLHFVFFRTTLDPIPTLPVGGFCVVDSVAGQNSVGLFALSLTAGVPSRH